MAQTTKAFHLHQRPLKENSNALDSVVWFWLCIAPVKTPEAAKHKRDWKAIMVVPGLCGIWEQSQLKHQNRKQLQLTQFKYQVQVSWDFVHSSWLTLTRSLLPIMNPAILPIFSLVAYEDEYPCTFERLMAGQPCLLKSFGYLNWRCHMCAMWDLLSIAVFPCPYRLKHYQSNPGFSSHWLPFAVGIATASAGLGLVLLIPEFINFLSSRLLKYWRQIPCLLFTNSP